ncbi:MAG TPA: lipoprotein insertase outer membrane protein LolB [Steroidobacteraceae bacterium]|nr:lipoprotein insertase outer membrane protein LolB [Steroidobacteraceae bacterium]
MLGRAPGLLGILAVAVIAGCRTVPVHPPAPSQPWEVTRLALQARDHFELKGRVAVAAGKDGFNAALRWTQDGPRSQVSLQGPLGAGGVQITADGNDLSIVTSHGDRLDSDAARAELGSRLGFDPPLGSLRYWIQGVPDPASPSQETLDSQQRLQTLQQNGWQIDYTAYAPAAGGSWLPSRLTVQTSGVRVRVIVDGWSG